MLQDSRRLLPAESVVVSASVAFGLQQMGQQQTDQ